MWWLFILKENNDDIAEYSYSRESEKLDGNIVYDKKTETATITVPCSLDTESKWSQKKGIGKFLSCVVGEGFPDKRRVVIG